MSTQRMIASAAILLGLVFWLFALWKWAIFGLDADVGFACGVTGIILVMGGTFGMIE